MYTKKLSQDKETDTFLSHCRIIHMPSKFVMIFLFQRQVHRQERVAGDWDGEEGSRVGGGRWWRLWCWLLRQVSEVYLGPDGETRVQQSCQGFTENI